MKASAISLMGMFLIVLGLVAHSACSPDTTAYIPAECVLRGTAYVLTDEDFDIYYNGILINGKRPFNDIAGDLGIDLDKDALWRDPRVMKKAASHQGEWYTVYYPHAERPELLIDFAACDSTGEYWLVGIDLTIEVLDGVTTNRGIGAWSHMNELWEAYGDGGYIGSIFLYDSSGHPGKSVYRYGLVNGLLTDNEITIHVNNATFHVWYIWVNYAFHFTFDKLEAYFY